MKHPYLSIYYAQRICYILIRLHSSKLEWTWSFIYVMRVFIVSFFNFFPKLSNIWSLCCDQIFRSQKTWRFVCSHRIQMQFEDTVRSSQLSMWRSKRLFRRIRRSRLLWVICFTLYWVLFNFIESVDNSICMFIFEKLCKSA